MIGAGPAGMTAACCLAKHDVLVEVHEVDSAVDGLAKTIRLWNQKVDLEPHRFFSSDPWVNTVWLEVAGTCHDQQDGTTTPMIGGKIFMLDRV